MQHSNQSLSTSGLFHLAIVYVVWSSTYLAIRLVVSDGSGFPPFWLGATRMVIAGLILLTFAYIKSSRIRITRKELFNVTVSGLLLWCGGNGLVMWAEQYANSGFTALIVASSPIWVAVIELIFYGKAPSPLLTASLLLGFGGLGVLVFPSLQHGTGTDVAAGIALIVSAISWGAGSLFQSRHPVDLPAPVVSGYQHLTASLGFMVLILLFGESVPTPTTEAWLAWTYLIIFGSIFAFTSFICALRLLPIHIAMTFAYVNPVLALLLGWWILDEPITTLTIVGACLVLVSVIGVFQDRLRTTVKETVCLQAE